MPWLFNVIPTILAMFNNPSWNIAKGLSNFNVHLCSLMISSFPFMNLIYLSISSQGQKLTNRTYKKIPNIFFKKTSKPTHLHFWGVQQKCKLSRVFPPQNQQKNPNKLEDLTYPGSAPATNPNVQQHHKPTWPVRPFWDFWFCGKGKLEEFMLKYVSLYIYIMINMSIYINIHVSCIYINDYKW